MSLHMIPKKKEMYTKTAINQEPWEVVALMLAQTGREAGKSP